MCDLSSISPQFTEETLRQIVKDSRKIESYEVTQCGTRGTSYQSELFRVKIKTDAGDEEVFVKALPRNLARRMTFRSPSFYKKEIEFLDKIWPAFAELQRKYKVADPYTDVPR